MSTVNEQATELARLLYNRTQYGMGLVLTPILQAHADEVDRLTKMIVESAMRVDELQKASADGRFCKRGVGSWCQFCSESFECTVGGDK